MAGSYDLFVIGAGPGGYVPALEAARAGYRVAVAERDQLGGTCLNRGCIPTKTLLHTSQLYREVSAAGPMGLEADALRVRMDLLQARKEAVVSSLQEGIAQQFQRAKIDLYPCAAQVAGPGRVRLAGPPVQEVAAEHILVAAGSQPDRLPIPGLDLPGVEDSTSLLNRAALYDRLVIIGGGVIGVEFATLYTDLGCEVTVLEAADRILPGLDRELSQSLRMVLRKRGAALHTGALLERVEPAPEGGLCCVYREKDQEQRVFCDGVLVAVGRRGCGQEAFTDECREQVSFQKGILQVDANFQTALPGVYAVGDAIGGVQLAHAATAQGCQVLSRLFPGFPGRDLSVIPSCVYTDPEIACAGLTVEEAKAAGLAARSSKALTSANGKSVLSGQERGLVKLVWEEGSRRLLGAQLF